LAEPATVTSVQRAPPLQEWESAATTMTRTATSTVRQREGSQDTRRYAFWQRVLCILATAFARSFVSVTCPMRWWPRCSVRALRRAWRRLAQYGDEQLARKHARSLIGFHESGRRRFAARDAGCLSRSLHVGSRLGCFV